MLKLRTTNAILVHYHIFGQMVMWQDGLDSTTADHPGIHIKATRTMTLALSKIGLINPTAGEIMLADIGLPQRTFARAGFPCQSPFGSDFIIPLCRTAAGR